MGVGLRITRLTPVITRLLLFYKIVQQHKIFFRVYYTDNVHVFKRIKIKFFLK
jgi:hypothetical protein